MTERCFDPVRPLVGTLLLFVVAALVPGCSQADGRETGGGALAKSGADDVSIEEGVLEAVSCMTVVARTRGQITWLAPEGSTVKKGDRVLELDHEQRLTQLDDREVSLEEARARVTELEDAFADQKKELDHEVKTAESARDLAHFTLKVLKDGPTPAARAEAKARLEKARAAYGAARDGYDRMRGLIERGVVSKDEKNVKWLESERARLTFKMEEVTWQLLVRGPEPITLAKAEQDIKVAELNVEVAKERRVSQVAQLRRGIEEAKLRVDRTRDEVRRVKRRIEQSVLRAPGKGMVVYGMVGHGRKTKVDVGSRVWPGSSLITLPDLTAFKVSTQVSEAIVGSLRVGQKVKVEVVSIDGVVYTGEIIHIDVWGQDRNELLDETGKKAEGLYGTKVYSVAVKILEEDDRLNLGIKARVHFPGTGSDADDQPGSGGDALA